MTRSIDAGVASRYLKKAEGSLKMARIALAEKEYDNAVMRNPQRD
jgi:HEPN domain-containing protein